MGGRSPAESAVPVSALASGMLPVELTLSVGEAEFVTPAKNWIVVPVDRVNGDKLKV